MDLEGDCQNLIVQLCATCPSLSEAGGIVEDIKMLAATFHSCSFLFTRRCNNQVAHLLARLAESNISGTSVLPCQNPDVI